MTTNDMPEKSFARETFPDDEPSHAWNLTQTEQYAQAQHEAIARGETTLAPTFQRMGRALELLRQKRGRGAWGEYLDFLGIHRVRACKARAIARHFSTPEAVARMTVEAAYDESKRNRVRAPRSRRGRGNADQTDSTENHDAQDAGAPGREHGVDEIKAFLADVRARADALVDAAAFAKQDARAALFPAYRAALERLQFFGRMLGVEDEALPRQNALENPD